MITCNCIDCQDIENACYFDCSLDNLCQGCHESVEEQKEIRFEIDKAQGRV